MRKYANYHLYYNSVAYLNKRGQWVALGALALAMLLLPHAALAKGPVVSGGQTAWAAILAFLGF